MGVQVHRMPRGELRPRQRPRAPRDDTAEQNLGKEKQGTTNLLYGKGKDVEDQDHHEISPQSPPFYAECKIFGFSKLRTGPLFPSVLQTQSQYLMPTQIPYCCLEE